MGKAVYKPTKAGVEVRYLEDWAYQSLAFIKLDEVTIKAIDKEYPHFDIRGILRDSPDSKWCIEKGYLIMEGRESMTKKNLWGKRSGRKRKYTKKKK